MSAHPRTGSTFAVFVAILCACGLGCHTTRPSTHDSFTGLLSSVSSVATDWRWRDSDPAFEQAIAVLATDPSFADTVRAARDAESARKASDPSCIELYTKVALDCWPLLETAPAGDGDDQVGAAVQEAYHYCVKQLVRNAVIHDRIDPSSHIDLRASNQESPRLLRISHHQFPWHQDDFSELQVVDRPSRTRLARYWAEDGLGVPLIALRRRETSEGFLGHSVPFAATCVLRPVTTLPHGGPTGDDGSFNAVLELHDPLRVREVACGDNQRTMARDVSAPLELANTTVDRDKLKSFLIPGREDEAAGLRMIEPYQPGKVPIVFVHGLLSDKFTWVDLANDLRSVPGFNQNYQLWSFQYQTGQTFVRSAAEMRRELSSIVAQLDPDGSDAALRDMVLVGHSMGGLVSKLQVAQSDQALWESVAQIPREEIDAPPEIQSEIDRLFFFEPLPFVSRVVFIGSPHQGSKMARGIIGTLGSALVISPRERVSQLVSLVEQNPDVFTGDLAKRLPTSVELLRPDNPILQATYQLEVNPAVQLHTIIGSGRALSDGTPADGVVAVESARHPGTESELQIDATHTELTSHPKVTHEIIRILNEHLQEIFDQPPVNSPRVAQRMDPARSDAL